MRGADSSLARRALDGRDPLPGTAGFAGQVDSRLVRDVLGRQPLFSERDDPETWSFDHRDLSDPVAVPPGHARHMTGESAGRDESVWELPDPPVATDREDALARVRNAVSESVRSVDDDGLAVAFSGGVDSAVVAAGVPDAPCYVAGFEGSHDIAAARDAADAMGRDLRVVELSHDALERAVPEIVDALGRTNPMDVQIVLPLYLLAEQVAADGYDRLAVGQGADELFGGYAKVAKAPDDPRVEAETVRGAARELIHTLPDQLERDVLVLRAAGVEPVAPLLHDRVVDAALPLPGELLVDGDRRKVALREAAKDSIPESVAEANKKAVQYGTYASRELDRLARQAGFKRRIDNHVEKYVRSLLE
ncbi:asparagine synthetase B [Haloferax mediterranei ATCC 33500]|uniref:Asparagine synthase n=1 Tax=Haloferax mediterranei (strain ATCC 33500 / DSM 1411 / JCM 8866 / NBRC 14739 / NCIMB 2177 / R-4) TaxID=523841 RepID=I3R3F5_HALMT|nr:asparagine synthase-related protein [Haloferax mediterranei]AFK18765.1 asparagine synthetase [Haloferax mediterranei ATCC 33500]AHZ21866.1 asparagine synthase [Haloferax mediterranei ATCC 33500]EMA03375.1 asparagine synthase [Haloferax mediterranei ATCC 33500]MDX5988861.1 asparagine synthase-related protein [Haloferax mediterranei ATCC 33500]QCQ75259.1 asparagine synthetase B [Haloferax mediterranei ATCC 33500]